MILTIDIGNSNIVMGVFNGDELVSHARFKTNKNLTPSRWQEEFVRNFMSPSFPAGKIENIIVSSVVPSLNDRLRQLGRERFKMANLVFVSHHLKLPITLDVDRPETVGADRIVASAAAHHFYKTDLIVIDLGTATTFDCVLKGGSYIGGVIAPGFETSARDLAGAAELLFDVAHERPRAVVGKNTADCLKSGFFYGYLGLMESLVERIQRELNLKMTVIATGGLAALFAPHIKMIHFHDENLILKGLKLISDWNRA